MSTLQFLHKFFIFVFSNTILHVCAFEINTVQILLLKINTFVCNPLFEEIKNKQLTIVNVGKRSLENNSQSLI